MFADQYHFRQALQLPEAPDALGFPDSYLRLSLVVVAFSLLWSSFKNNLARATLKQDTSLPEFQHLIPFSVRPFSRQINSLELFGQSTQQVRHPLRTRSHPQAPSEAVLGRLRKQLDATESQGKRRPQQTRFSGECVLFKMIVFELKNMCASIGTRFLYVCNEQNVA